MRFWSLMLHGPLLLLFGGYAGLVLCWWLRVHARSGASYEALAGVSGEPGSLEKYALLLVVLSGAVFLTYRVAVQ